MRALGEHLHIGLVVGVDLTALEDLERYGTVLIVGKERSATRFAYILHDATHAHWAVEFLA